MEVTPKRIMWRGLEFGRNDLGYLTWKLEQMRMDFHGLQRQGATDLRAQFSDIDELKRVIDDLR